MAYPDSLPIIPVNVRVICLVNAVETKPEKEAEEVLALFRTAADWWLTRAGVEFKLVGDAVEIVEDDALSKPRGGSVRDSLDAFATRTHNWVTLVFVIRMPLTETKVDGSDYDFKSHGITYFFQPSVEVWSYGAVIGRREATWGTVAHELGHLLGLPHPTATPQSSVEGGSYAMAPFEDDTREFESDLDFATNLMHGKKAASVIFDAAWLTPSQLRRARLTIGTRTCGVAVQWADGNAPEGVPLLNDIAGDYLAQLWL